MGCGASAGTKPAPAAEAPAAATPAAKMDDTKLVEETAKKPPAAGSGLGARYAATKRRAAGCEPFSELPCTPRVNGRGTLPAVGCARFLKELRRT